MGKAKLNNRGAALVSVLVVTTFITLIATTMLYVAAMNYQQKLTDYQNKQSFYGAEKALDELKSIMVKDVQMAYLEAYNKTAREFLLLKTSQARKEYFQDEFTAKLKNIWETRVAANGDDLVAAVKSVMTGVYAAEADCIYKVADYGIYETATDTGTAQKFAIKGVQVKYTSGNYTTFLYTDICLEPPQVDWSADSFSTTTVTAPNERDTIAFTDYVSYINWRKADYDDSYNTDIGTKVTDP